MSFSAPGTHGTEKAVWGRTVFLGLIALFVAATVVSDWVPDQAILDVWGKPQETVVTKVVRHERNAPTGKVTRSWWECSLERLDGRELRRNLRESDFIPVAKACPADAEVGGRLVVYAVSGDFAWPQTSGAVGGVWLVI